jgi:hypothetical protein
MRNNALNLKKNILILYKKISAILLAMALYAIAFPAFSKILAFLNPNLTKCPYKSLTGNDCPLCGGTRLLDDILDNGITLYNFKNPIFYIIILIVVQIIFRFFALLKKNVNIKKIILIDIILSSLFLTYIIVYFIIFFLF